MQPELAAILSPIESYFGRSVFGVLCIFFGLAPTEGCNSAPMFHLREESLISPLLKVTTTIDNPNLKLNNDSG